MFELEKAIRDWRAELGQAQAIGNESLRELESHLRDQIDVRVSEGDSQEAAFVAASSQLGHAALLNEEYAKVHESVPWQRRLFAVLVGYLLLTMVLPILQVARGLTEILCVRLGWTQILSLPFPQDLNRDSPLDAMAPEGVLAFERLSLVSVIAHGLWWLSLGVLIVFVFLCFRGFFRKSMAQFVSYLSASRARLVFTVLLMGFFSIGLELLIGVGNLSLSRPVYHPQEYDLGMEAWEFVGGEITLINYLPYPNSMVHFLIGVGGFLAYRKARLLGLTCHPVTQALSGYVLIVLALAINGYLGGLAHTVYCQGWGGSGVTWSSGSVLVLRVTEILAFASLGVGVFLAFFTTRMPTARRVLANLWNRPKTVLACWLLAHLLVPLASLIVNPSPGGDSFAGVCVESLNFSSHFAFFSGLRLSLSLTVALLVLALGFRFQPRQDAEPLVD